MIFKTTNNFNSSFPFHFIMLLLFFSFTSEISTEEKSIFLKNGNTEIIKFTQGECPENFVYSKEHSVCILKCIPALPIDYPVQKAFRIIQIVCGTLSFICCAIYCIYAVLRYELLLSFPASNIFWVFFVIWCLSISVIIPAYIGFNDYYCIDEATPIDYNSSLCRFQAIISTVPMMWSILWWTFYNFSMMLLLHGVKLKGRRIFATISWLIIMIYPVIAMIIFVTLDYIEYSPLGCTVAVQFSGVVYGLYVIPILFGTLSVNTIIIIIVSLSVFYKYAKKKQFKYIIIKQYRLILLYAYYITIVSLTIYTIVLVISKYDTWKINFQNYITCVLEKWYLNQDYQSLCDDNIEYHAPNAVSIIIDLLTSSLGWTLFLILVCRQSFFDWWKSYFVNCWKEKTIYPPSSFLRSQNVSDN